MPCCNGVDWDDALAYKTVKTVKVRHRWLGCIYYTSMIAIVVYTVVNTLVIKEGYVRQISVLGAIRSTVHAPNYSLHAPSWESAPYCMRPPHTEPTGKYSPILPCIFPDVQSGMFSKSTPTGELLIGTRVSTTVKEPSTSCNFSDFMCDPWITSREKESKYVGAIENCTVLIQNSVRHTHRYFLLPSLSHFMFKSCQVSKATQSEYGGKIMDSFVPSRPIAIM